MSTIDRMAQYNENENKKYFLKKSIKKNIITSIIGVLFDLETSVFGELWGQGIPFDRLNVKQREFRLAYEKLRTSILDRGNEQARMAEVNLTNFLKDSK